MRTILCTGDSHTWGQGVAGLEETFYPPVRGGDLRLAPFSFDFYVNLLRNKVNDITCSLAEELSAGEIGIKYGNEMLFFCAAVKDTPLTINTHANLIRIQFRYLDAPSKAAVYIDGQLIKTINLQRQNTENGYCTEAFFCGEKGARQLTISPQQGIVLVYRMEFYTGSAAVINCGIGSCTTFRYLAEYWDDYVVKLKPSLVILEPHTINDWLSGNSPHIYGQNLQEMVSRLKRQNCRLVMLTVSPILGPQAEPFNSTPYDEYVQQSRRTAQSLGIPLCDANAKMAKMIKGLSEEEAFNLLFRDNWHVNELGHKIYADTILETLINMKLI